MIRGALIAALRGYRRWLSGRGPLRRVRCTFHPGETCGAFGLRAAREAPTAWHAVGRIRRRVRRCRDASVVLLDGGRALGWGRDHERPLAEVVAELVADGEGPAARATVLAGRELVARWRSDAEELRAVAAARAGLPRATLPVRGHRPRRPRPLRVVAAAAALGLALVVAPWLGLALIAAVGLLVLGPGRAARAHRRRLGRQARAAALRGAVPTLAPGPDSRYETA